MRRIPRRRFLGASGALLAAPLAAFAQPAPRVYRIGFLGTAVASGYAREVDWIRAGLRALGYTEGRNIVIEYRWAEGDPDRAMQIAKEFVAMNVDLILCHGLPGALPAARATSSIPIVMADGADPVAAGLAASLARPGRNVTGSTSFVAEEGGKRLQLLKEIAPRIRRVAFLASAQLPPTVLAATHSALEAAAASFRVELKDYFVKRTADLPDAFKAMGTARIDAAVINNEPLLNAQASVIAGLASATGLPSVGYASYADAGGLLAYGANRAALYGRVGYFVDRIFKGARPGDIPFERAAKFDLIVNLTTARALDLSVPQPILSRADRLIE